MESLLTAVGNFVREFGTPLFVFAISSGFIYLLLRIIQNERNHAHELEAAKLRRADAEQKAKEAADARENALVDKFTNQLEERLKERDAIFMLYKDEAEHKIKSLQIRVEQAVSEAKEAKQLYSAEKMHSEELEAVNRKLQDVNENLVETNRKLILENSTLTAKFADMEARLSAMEAMEERLKTLEDELARKEREIQELRQQYSPLVQINTAPAAPADELPKASGQ